MSLYTFLSEDIGGVICEVLTVRSYRMIDPHLTDGETEVFPTFPGEI